MNKIKSIKLNKGFTLIELVMVIVILGVLAATALPKFIDLSGKAEVATLAGVKGTIESAVSINYAGCKAGSASCVAVADCTDASNTLAGGVPTGYVLTAGAINPDEVVACTLTQSSTSATALVSVIGS